MSLFESASLVVTPNGTKASKLYAIKPTDGSGDLSVTRATTATRVNSSGLISSVATNVPRLDYTNSTCPSILVEPQRTNLLLRSQEFSNVIWVKDNTTVTSGFISPSGAADAFKLIESATNAEHRIYQIVGAIGTVVQSMSFYAKAGERNWVSIRFETGVLAANFNLSTGVVGSVAAGANASIENAGNGWYKCKVSGLSATLTNIMVINIGDSDTGTAPSYSYLGNGTSGVYIWGAQLEQGSYATSYIPTTSASVTRNADVISKTGISSLIGQTEGTIFLDVKAQLNTADEQDFSISDGTTNNRAFIRLASSGVIRAIGVFAGSTEFNIGSTEYTTGTRYKIALAYKNNDVVLYINGSNAGSTSTTTISGTLSRLGFDVFTNGAQTIVSPVNAGILFKTRLSNAELAQLTTI